MRLSEQEYKEQKEQRIQKYEADRVLIEQSMAELEATYVVQQSDSIYDMVLIPKGEFMMGALENDRDAYDDERPRHKVTLTRDFLMGKYAVTQALWESVMGSNPSQMKGENRPVENVSWFDVVDFCNKLSKQSGLEPVYTINGHYVTCNWNAKGYRLPTEAEWEYSARGGEYHKYAGSNNVHEVAWYDGNGRGGWGTHSVGQKKPNGFGLYDMSGNVAEWVWDWFSRYTHGLSRIHTVFQLVLIEFTVGMWEAVIRRAFALRIDTITTRRITATASDSVSYVLFKPYGFIQISVPCWL